MPNSASDHDALEPVKRLALKLTSDGCNATFEFALGDERVRTVGRNAKSDLVVVAKGVLPVHAYFERDGHEIWIAPSQRGAQICLGSTEVVVRAPLPESCVIQLGEAELNATVVALHDDAPKMDSQITAPIDRAGLRYTLDYFRTASMDVSSLFEDQPTTEWKRPSTLRPPPPNAAPEPPLQRTQAIPRAVLAVAPQTQSPKEQITEPLPVVPAISTVTELIQRPFAPMATTRDVWPLPIDADLPFPEAPASDRPRASSVVVVQRVAEPGDTAPLRVHAPTPGASEFVTTSAPIADIVGPPPGLAPIVPPRPKPSQWSDVRRVFAAWERKPLPVLALLLLAMAVFAALGRQGVLAWRQAHAPLVQSHAPAMQATSAPPQAAPAPTCALGGARDEALAAQEAADPKLHEAVQHLVRGRRPEASNAYAELASRYPTDCAFSIASKVLKQKGGTP